MEDLKKKNTYCSEFNSLTVNHDVFINCMNTDYILLDDMYFVHGRI